MNAINMRTEFTPDPSFHPELEWLEQTVSWRRHSVWETPLGQQYEGDGPRYSGDREIGYYPVTQVTGIVVGRYPELGRLQPPTMSGPLVTEVASPERRGKFVSEVEDDGVLRRKRS